MKLQRKIKRHIKRHIKRALAGAAMTAMLITAPVFALPQNPNVVVGNGQITIDNGAGGIMNIAVGANGVIDWSSFSIASGETVNFNFADTLAVLNRVTGNSMSELYGALNSTGANGSIFLINPNGVLVGQGATINASNLVLSTLDISNNDFMALASGNDLAPLTFAKNSQQASAGKIEIESGVALNHMAYLGLVGGSITIAPNVTIETTGNISLVAADAAKIHFGKYDNGALEHVFTESFTSQDTNSINITGTIKSDWMDILGNNITFDKAKLTAISGMAVLAGNKSQTEYSDVELTTVTATPDNKITLTESTISFNAPPEKESHGKVIILGGQVDLNNSNIHVIRSTSETPKVIMTAANNILVQQGRENDEVAIARIHVTDATPNNAITLNKVSITDTITNTTLESDLKDKDTTGIFMLGGKVDITGTSDIKGGEVLIGAGTNLGVEAWLNKENDTYYDEYYFTNYFKSSLGNTVNLGEDTTLVANGEAAIYANAVSNAGTINSHGHYGINIRAFDERDFNEEGNIGYQISSKNNTFVNTGTIYADQANFDPDADPEYGIIGIGASFIDNTGTIKASRHKDAFGDDKTEGATELFAVGTVTGVDTTDKSIKVDELKLDLDNYNYRLIWQGEGDMRAPNNQEPIPLHVDPTDPGQPTDPGNPIDPGDPTDPGEPTDPTDPNEPTDPIGPTNPAVDDILNGDGTLEEKQEQIIEVVNTINELPANKQAAAVESAINSILEQESLSQSEKESLISSVVNTYEGTAASKTESNNITSINQANTNTAENVSSSDSTFASTESESNVTIQ